MEHLRTFADDNEQRGAATGHLDPNQTSGSALHHPEPVPADSSGTPSRMMRQESMLAMRVILSPCRRTGTNSRYGNSARGRPICGEWRNG